MSSRLSLRGWDNGSGAAKVLTTDFADGDNGAICDDAGTSVIAPSSALWALVTCTLAGTALTTLHLQLIPSPDGVVKRGALPNVDSIALGVVTYGAGSHEWSSPGTTLKRTFPIPIAPNMYYFLQAKRTDGDTDSTLIAVLDFV